MPPQIVMPDSGYHNRNLEKAAERLRRGQTYRNLSTIWVIPTRGGRSLMPRVVTSWMNLFRPMNQRCFGPIFLTGDEVGIAYNNAVEMVLNHPDLKKWRYFLTVEDDNMPPPDGLLKLYEAIEGGADGQKYDAVGGLYWTKGDLGQPMCYGKPQEMPLNFIPWLPPAESVAQCNGLGMGFTLFRLEMFKDPNFIRPFFRTVQEHDPVRGSKGFTQDLFFFEQAGRIGYKFACDSRVRVGHYDENEDRVW